MLAGQGQGDTQDAGSGQPQPSAPTISLPKGGGAIRGIGEKFAANPVTGTGSLSVPIATSPGRSGFGPELSLSYDSGAGNGPFGFGWGLSLPSITRKTDKGLPQYRDAEQLDVFILSGAEDLVPVFVETANGWQPETIPPRQVDGKTYVIQRYRPRIEGLFARIERWTDVQTGEIHWRSISRDNITTLYGKDNKSRIFDPAELDKDDPANLAKAHPTRIFSWLICQSYDDKGNAIIYEYQREDSQRIFEDQQGQFVARAHERNRDATSRTANRYLKRIKYGNRAPNRDATTWQATDAAHLPDETWMFEVVFDYGEGHYVEDEPDAEGRVFARAQIDPPAGSHWPARQDPFSSYRAGFEVRTYRLCQRVLMFHHFADEEGVGNDCLVRSTAFTYVHEQEPTSARNPVYTFLRGVTQSGYKREGGGYLTRSLPPVEFEYSQPVVQDAVEQVDSASLENLPIGLDGAAYQWTDLHGEGIPGILTEQGGAWFYKRNLSPINVKSGNGSAHTDAKFAPMERVALKPNLALAGGAQFMDLAGDGQPDLVVLDGPVPGLYEHDGNEGWQPFRPFTARLNRDTRDPNLKFVDLDGDGHADVLITEDDAFVWHPSLAGAGFGLAHRAAQALDEEKGPRLVFADGTQSIYLADLSGDGLTDLVRIRNGEVCYWPNLGYGRFGAKVTMDHASHFDHPDQFDHRRIRLADIDGTGTTDIIYLHRDGVRLYFNQSGNSWSEPQSLHVFPPVDEVVSIVPTDLLGNGTACLVWSSPLPGDARRPMRYVNLMGGQKPHLLVRSVNNLGAETRVQYAPSTKFYLQDKRDGKPWLTRLPFPVHVVERVDTYDHVSRNRFVTRYAYHHGYFDGEEREFRGFGMVEQWDTETIAALAQSDPLAPAGGENWLEGATNIDAASHVPPVHTKTWFHTGVYVGRDHISDFFGGLLDAEDKGEYYREPGLTDDQARALLLPDTVLPPGLTLEEEREACRALKGAMLRQEVYALDGTLKEGIPYTVTEQNFTIRHLQPRDGNRHAVFFTHACEAITYHYERRLVPILNGQIVDEVAAASDPNTQWLPDPRVQHALTLEVDEYGNVLRSIAVGYPRRNVPERQPEQNETHLTLTLNRVVNRDDQTEWYRIGSPVETRTYELVKPPATTQRFTWEELSDLVTALIPLDQHVPSLPNTIPYEQWDWRKPWDPQTEPGGLVDGVPTHTRLRLIEHVRTFYRPDDLGKAQNNPLTLLPLGTVQSMALPGESYKLAFTPGLLAQVFQRNGQALLPNPTAVLEGQGPDWGGYVAMDGHWWISSGRVFYSPGANDNAATELTFARHHFFLPHRYRDPFAQTTFVSYDSNDTNPQKNHNLLVVKTEDAVGNTLTAGNDYRVLQPRHVVDPNGNHSEVRFDALGMMVGTAVMGKATPTPVEGDSFANFTTDLTPQQIKAYFDAVDPRPLAITHLGTTTTRIIYDLDRVPACAATIARETHVSDLAQDQQTKVQLSVGYSDGFGREIQKKIHAEPGPVPKRDPATGKIITVNGQPEMTPNDVSPRWVGSGWTIFNNKGKPVRQYEPFFTDTHRFEFDVRIGVSPILFYDPVERVVASLHPNHTWEKVVFDPWRQETWDVNDTVAIEPQNDKDVKGFFVYPDGTLRLSAAEYLPTWYALRSDPAYAAEANQLWPDPKIRDAEKAAAEKSAVHAETPTVAHFDTLGRPFLTVAYNRFERGSLVVEEKYPTRVELDIEGNQRAVRDAIVQNGDPLGRIVMQYDYDMLGNVIHQASMEAGERWMLNDVSGKPIRAWDSRQFMRRMTYDALRRPTGLFVTDNGAPEFLAEKTEYGESKPDPPEATNHRGKVWKVYDGAGIVTSEDYDFKGNLLHSTRQLLPDYKNQVNWLQNPAPNDGSFTSHTTYDALNRPLTVTSPDGSVYRPAFNEANLLDKVDVNLRGEQENGQPKWTPFVTHINYDAKGQRKLIAYGNGAQTTYEYDRLTFRLLHLKTTRPTGLNGLVPIFANPTVVQDLHYTYDPAGNITRIEDRALKTLSHNNQPVEPVCSYTYDAVYRLVEAKGREHIGQTAHDFNPPEGNRRDYPFVGHQAHPNDLQALRNYTERYDYDTVGNFDIVRHSANGGSWTRSYEYSAASLVEPGKQSNRLTKTTVGNGSNFVETYTYTDAQGNDVQGCMTTINSMKMAWDFKDQLQQVDLGGGGTAYYVYDASGQRVRKVIHRQNGTRQEERIYLGGYEIYREHNDDGQTVTLERETLHVMDDKQRIALVETKTVPAVGQLLIRYQVGNHLGSVSVELDKDGGLISYEEYHPSGTTSFQAMGAAEVSLKRYRYTRKERDEESGLYYYGARYYTPWLGRWVSCDPGGLVDGLNLYCYVHDNPIALLDPGGRMSKAAQAEYEKNRHASERMSPDQIGDVYKHVEDVPKAMDKPPRPSADTVLQQQRRLHQGEAQRAQTKPPPIITKEEKFEAAKAGARNWLLDKAAEGVGQAAGLPEGGQLARLALEPLRAPAPPESITNLRELEMKENYEGMQTTLTIAEVAVTLVAPMVAESALATRMPSPPRLQLGDAPAREFVKTPAVKFSNELTPAESRAWELSNELGAEYSLTNDKGMSSIPHPEKSIIEVGPHVETTAHTHPTSGVALPSAADVKLFQNPAFAPSAKHRVVGAKWPHANTVLRDLNLPIEPAGKVGIITTEQARAIDLTDPEIVYRFSGF